MAHIGVLGLWHQGTVLAGCLADLGHTVWGADDDADRVTKLQSGEPPVHEPGLPRLLRRSLRAGRLHFTTDARAAMREAEFVYLSVDTPFGPAGEPDLRTILDLAGRIGRGIVRDTVVVVTAQVPVGTCERIAALIRAEQPQASWAVVYVPEFLRLGSAVQTFRRADRFVVGADDPMVADRVATLYRPLRRPVILTNHRTAEMAKHACNAFLALSISAINEIADLCELVGADVVQVAEIMKRDPRIGRQAYLSPGLGFAGGTLGRDIRALQGLAREHDCETSVFDAVMRVNERRPGLVGRRLQEIYPTMGGLTVGVFGLTYKPGTSTLRGSIAIDIIRDLVGRGAAVRAFDPLVQLDETSDLPAFVLSPDPYAAAEGCDAVVLVTPWSRIDDLDLRRLRAVMRRPVVLDTLNHFDPLTMQEAGFVYMGVGRGMSPAGSAQMERKGSSEEGRPS